MKAYFDGSPNKVAIVIDEQTMVIPTEPTPVDKPLQIEYKALITTLEILNDNSKYTLYSDNQSLVARMNCDHELPPSNFTKTHSQVIELIKQKKLSVQLKWVPRKKNLAGKLI